MGSGRCEKGGEREGGRKGEGSWGGSTSWLCKKHDMQTLLATSTHSSANKAPIVSVSAAVKFRFTGFGAFDAAASTVPSRKSLGSRLKTTLAPRFFPTVTLAHVESKHLYQGLSDTAAPTRYVPVQSFPKTKDMVVQERQTNSAKMRCAPLDIVKNDTIVVVKRNCMISLLMIANRANALVQKEVPRPAGQRHHGGRSMLDRSMLQFANGAYS